MIIEKRLNSLEGELDQLRQQAERRAGQIERTLDALRHDLEAERQARTTADTETNRRIAAVTVEGLHWEIIGLWWLAIATVASTWPEWIAKLL